MIWTVSLGELIGFGFILITLWANSWLARRAQKHHWAHEEETRRKELERERDSMRKVLGAELSTLETITADPIKKMEADPTEILTANVELDLDESFQSLVSRIGWLSRLEVELIPLAYHLRRAAAGKLKLFGEPHGAFSSHVKVDPEHFPKLIEKKKETLSAIKSAIAALEDEGLCRKCGKEASEVGCSRQEHTDGTVTETWQGLCEPCSNELKSLTESQPPT